VTRPGLGRVAALLEWSGYRAGMRRVMIIPLAIAALSLPACGGDTAGAPAAPTPVVTDMLDDLKVARGAFERGAAEQTYGISFQISAGDRQLAKIDMSVDAAADVAKLTMVSDEYVEMLKFGDELLVKQAGTDTFVRFEIDKLRVDSPLRGSLDLAQQSGLLAGVLISHKVEETAGKRVYEGRAQLQAALNAAPAKARETMEATLLRARNAQAVPFRLGVDERGRLLHLAYELETTEGPIAILIRMSDHGTAVTVDRPKPEQVEEATAKQYAAL